jgi:hypothetical protein
MKIFLVVATITLASCAVSAQEHTPRPPVSTPTPVAPKPIPNNTPDSSGWVRFTSEAGRFSVLMPELPSVEAPTVTQSEHGPYTTHLFITRVGNSGYLIGWVDYDPNFNFNRLQELEANRDNFVKGIKATLLDSRTLTIDGFQVIEFICETQDRRFKSRVYMVGRRPYQIVIMSPKTEDDSVATSRFFNSFKVSQR